MSEWKQYKRNSVAEMRPYVPGEILPANVSISSADQSNGSPKAGDMIARNPQNHSDQWLVSASYFDANFETQVRRKEMNRTTPLTIEETRALWSRLHAILDSTELNDVKFKARRPDPNEAASFLFWYCNAAEDAFLEIEKILDNDFPDWAKHDGTQKGDEQ